MDSARPARPDELEAIYLMGFDAWGEGAPLEQYLAGCRASLKYRQGRWFVLADGAGPPKSSLLVHGISPGTAGLGSIATPPQLRGQGHASALIRAVLSQLEAEGSPDCFLFSDIRPEFYARFGFAALPEEHQHHSDSVCMLRSPRFAERLSAPDFTPPPYF